MKYGHFYTDEILETLEHYTQLSEEEQQLIRDKIKHLCEPYVNEIHSGNDSLCNKLYREYGDVTDRYCDIELNTNEILFLIDYPRWRGNHKDFSEAFAMDGRLLKYILLLKETDLRENATDDWKDELTEETMESIPDEHAGQKTKELIRKLITEELGDTVPIYIIPVDLSYYIYSVIGKDFRKRYPGKEERWTRAKFFIQDMLRATLEKRVEEWIVSCCSIDMLVFEDVELICGNERAEAAFCDVMEQRLKDGKRTVFMSKHDPYQLPYLPDRIRSIICSGIVVNAAE